jgi:hypothetical protein
MTKVSCGVARQTAAQDNVASVIMLKGWTGCPWFEARFARQPLVSLVYPCVHPAKVDGGENQSWRGLWRIFRFRPRPPINPQGFLKPRYLFDSGVFQLEPL